MPWPEAQIDELIANVRRDFALQRITPEFEFKLQTRGIPLRVAERVVSKKSYIAAFDHHGPAIGFLDPRSLVFVAWKADYPTEVKTCFVADDGLDYVKRQNEFQLIWKP
jgi:hypothetical protein